MLPAHMPGHPRIWLGPTRRHSRQFAEGIIALSIGHWGWHQLFFQLLDKQPNFVFGLVRVCADKIQLRSKSAAMRLGSH